MKYAAAIGAMAIAVTLLPMSGPAQELHHPLCLFGCPSETPLTNDLIIREIYVLSSNDTTKFADWVAYKITRETIGPGRARTWKADPLLAAADPYAVGCKISCTFSTRRSCVKGLGRKSASGRILPTTALSGSKPE